MNLNSSVNSSVNFCLGVLLVLGLAGCAVVAAPKPQPVLPPPAEMEGLKIEGLKINDIMEARTGRALSQEELFRETGDARIIYVGETHTSVEDHRVQEAVLAGLLERRKSVTVALEMLPREAQGALDRFIAGTTTEEEFFKESDWEGVWGFPFQLYRNIFIRAREQHLRMLALNAPPTVVRQIARNGVASLSPSDRARIASEYLMSNPRHRAVIQEQFDQHHGEGLKSFDTFYEAQLAWEETMAETLARALSSPAGDGAILVLVGKGHLSHGLGVPHLVAKRAGGHRFAVIAPMPIDYPGSLTDPDLGDFIWITDRAPAPFHRPRLGMMIRQAAGGKGLEVLNVLAGSPAEAAGILTGDTITAINGHPVQSIEDLHQSMPPRKKTHRIDIRRGPSAISVTITLPSP